MSISYAKQQPIDKNGQVYQNSPPPFTALQRFADEDGSVSSVITLNDGTTVIEVSAVTSAALVKWIASTDTQASVVSTQASANYDVIVPAGTLRRLVIPQETAGTSSIVGAGVQAGTYRRVAYKNMNTGSVLTAEY